MSNAALDQNSRPTLTALSNIDGSTIVNLYADPVTHRLLVDLSGGGGTVTNVSVASANGLAGSVANATTTPIITLSTTITGVLSGDGTAISAATTTGSGSVVLSSGATLVNPALGTPSSVTLTNATGLPVATGISGLASGMTSFLSTPSSANLAATVTDETGSGSLVFATSPTLVTPSLGVATATSINGNIFTTGSSTYTGTAAQTYTFPTTSATLARTDAGQTFTGTNAFGVITATSLNGNTFTTGTYTLTGVAGKTLTFNKSITLEGTDSTTMTFPSTTATIARTDAANTFTGVQTTTQVLSTNNAITASGNAATVPITSKINTVTNNSAATLTITLTTSGAIDRQVVVVCILDAGAVAQTITWVNTENSTLVVPTTSNGSTTLPLTVGFMYNNATSKWRCIAVA